MKRLHFIIALGLLTSTTLNSQPCFPDGITFTTQAEIDSFPINNPNCSEIEGFVKIGNGPGVTNIYNLNGLSGLTSIGGYLRLYNNIHLTSFEGLANLTSIGDNFDISNCNNYLNDLTGLENLTYIGGRFWVESNDSLISFTGLENLTIIGGDYKIESNYSLTSFSGLENLSIIGGSLLIYGNNSLQDLTGLEGLDSISGSLLIGTVSHNVHRDDCIGNPELSSFKGLDRLKFIGEDFGVFSNDNLITFTGLESLNYVGGNFEIGTWYFGVHGGVQCFSNPRMSDLLGLNNLTSVEGNFRIVCSDSLTNFAPLANLTTVGGTIDIGYGYEGYALFGNPLLTSLTGLDNIDAFSIDNMYITNNFSLTECAVQSICDYLLSPNGEVIIENNSNGCNSLEQVDSACVYVTFDENPIEVSSNIYPNPFCCSTTIAFALNQPGTVRITFYNQYGKQVDVIEESQQKGLNKIVWMPENLADGIYYFKLIAGEQVVSGKVVLMK